MTKFLRAVWSFESDETFRLHLKKSTTNIKKCITLRLQRKSHHPNLEACGKVTRVRQGTNCVSCVGVTLSVRSFITINPTSHYKPSDIPRSTSDSFISPVSKQLSMGFAWRKRVASESHVKHAAIASVAAPPAVISKSPEGGALARRAVCQSILSTSRQIYHAKQQPATGLVSSPAPQSANSPQNDSKENTIAAIGGKVSSSHSISTSMRMALSPLPSSSPLMKAPSSRTLR